MADYFEPEDQSVFGSDEPQDQKPVATPTPTPQAEFKLNPDWDIDQFIDEYSKYKGVPGKLIQSLRTQESAGGKNKKPNKRTQATGDFQYLPSTAKEKGIDPTDPFESAAQTINDFSDRFKKWKDVSENENHAWQRVIASHYAGEGAVEEAIKAGKYVPETYPKDKDGNPIEGEPTTPEYVSQIWSRYLGEEPEKKGAVAGADFNIKAMPAEAKAYEAIANASQKDADAMIKKMTPEQRSAYESWVYDQTKTAEEATPLGQKGIRYTPETPKELLHGIEREQKYPTLDNIEVPGESEGAVYTQNPNVPTAPTSRPGGNEEQYNQFLVDTSAAYEKGKQTGDWTEYQKAMRSKTFAPVVYTSQAQDEISSQKEIEDAVRASARQISTDENEINAMIAEWRAKGNGRIQIFNTQTGQEMIPQPGQPFQVALSAEQAFRLHDHARKVAADKTAEIEDRISPTGAYLMGLGSVLRAGGILQYAEGKTMKFVSEAFGGDGKFGRDWAEFGYDPDLHQYYQTGLHASDFGLIPGTPAFERAQTKLDAGHMAGEITGEILKIFTAHKAVGAVGKFLDPKFAKFVDPFITKMSKMIPGFEIPAIGGEIATESALATSARALSGRVSQALGQAAAWGGFNTLTSPDSLKVDWDKATNAMSIERGIASTDTDAQGNLIFKKEDWVDVGLRMTREMKTLLLMSAFIYPTAGVVRATFTNPRLQKLLKPVWIGVNEERGVSRADAELSLQKTITNGAMLNAVTNAIAAPMQSYVLHPDLDWTKRLLDIGGIFAMGTVLTPGRPEHDFYVKHPETGDIYKFSTGDAGIKSEVVKTTPKGAEVYEPISKDELNIYSMMLANQYGSPEQKAKMFNTPEATVPPEMEAAAEHVKTPAEEAPVEQTPEQAAQTAHEGLTPDERYASRLQPGPQMPEEPVGPEANQPRAPLHTGEELTAEQKFANKLNEAEPLPEERKLSSEEKFAQKLKGSEYAEEPTSNRAEGNRTGTENRPVTEPTPIVEGPRAGREQPAGRPVAESEVRTGVKPAETVATPAGREARAVETKETVNPNTTEQKTATTNAAEGGNGTAKTTPKAAILENALEENPNFRPDLKDKTIKSGTDRYKLTGNIIEKKGQKFAEVVTPSGNKFPLPLDEVEKEVKTKGKAPKVEATPEAGTVAPEYKDKTVTYQNKAYKLTGETEKRGSITYYKGVDAKGNEKLIPQESAEKKKFFRIDTLFGDYPEKQAFRDRVKLALTRFNIDRKTSHFDVTDLGNAHSTEDNNLFLDPQSSHDLALASIRAYANGELGNFITPSQAGAMTLKGSALKELLPHIDNPRLVDAIKKLSDSEATVVDVYRSSRAISHLHESIHQNLFTVKFKPESADTLGATQEFKDLRAELERIDSSYKRLSDADLADEAIAFGLTGDYKTLGVSRKTLAEAGAKALKQLAADNPDIPLATLKKLSLQAGREIVEQHRKDTAAAKAFGYSDAHEAGKIRQEIVDEANPETILDAHKMTPDEFNETYATSIPVQERAAILTDVGKEPFGIHGVPIVERYPTGVYPIAPREEEHPTGVYPVAPREQATQETKIRFPEFGETIPIAPKSERMSARKATLLAYGNKVFYDTSADQENLVVKAQGNPVRLNELVKKAGYDGYYSGDSQLPGGAQMNLFGEDLTTGKKARKTVVQNKRTEVQEHQMPLFTKETETKAREVVANDETLTPEEKQSVNQVVKILREGPTKPSFKPKKAQRDLAAQRIKEAGERAAKAYEGVTNPEVTAEVSAADRLKALRMADLPIPTPKAKPGEQTTLPFPEPPPENIHSLISGFYEIAPQDIQTRVERLKAIALEQGLDISKRMKRKPEEGEDKQKTLFRIEEEVAADLLKATQEKLFEAGKTSKPRKRAPKKVKPVTSVAQQPGLDFESVPEQTSLLQQAPANEVSTPTEQLTPRQIAEKLRGFQKPATEIPTPQSEASLMPPDVKPEASRATSPMSAIEMLRAARAQAAQQNIQAEEKPVETAKPLGNSIGDRIRRIADMVDSGATTNLADVLRNMANELQPVNVPVVETPKIETFDTPDMDRMERMKRLANAITPKFRLEDDPETFVKNGSYVIISGNKARSQSEAGLRATQDLQRELQRKGFTFYNTTGKIQGNEEQSLLVPVKDKDEIDLLKGLGFKYKQNQVFVSHLGNYYAPYTDGITNRENFSRTNNMVVGDDALADPSHTSVHYVGGTVNFSVPDLFNGERASRITPKQQKIYDSVANEAKFAKAQGFSARIAERTLGLPQEGDINDAFKRLDYLYSRRFPRTDNIEPAEQIARYVNDWTGTVRDIIDNGLENKQWYSDDINQMFTTLGHNFPGIDASKSARLAFATMLATTSPRTSVTSNYAQAKDVFTRFIKSLEGTRPTVNRMSNDPESDNFTYYKGVQKLDKLLNGYVFNYETKKMEFSRYFRGQINKNGMQAVFDYLMSPGSKRAIIAQDLFGPKVGSFLANLYGNTQIPTVDSWIARSWRLNNGKMFNAKGELNDGVSEGLGNRIRGAIQSISARLNQEGYDVTPLEVQSLIWSHIKGMSDNLTGRKSAYKYSDAARRSFDGQSVQLEQFFNKYGQSLQDSNPNIGQDEYIQRAKSKSRMMFRNDDEYLRDLRDDVFYSHLERKAEEMLPDKTSIREIKQFLDSPKNAISKDEIKFSWVNEYLNEKAEAAKVSKEDFEAGKKYVAPVIDKQDFLNTIRKNRIKLYEYASDKYADMADVAKKYRKADDQIYSLENKQFREGGLTEEDRQNLEDAYDRRSVFEKQMDPHYRFMVNIPNPEAGPFLGEQIVRGRIAKVGVLPDGENYRAYLVKAKGIDSADHHYMDGDSIGAMRVNDIYLKSGESAFNVEELQSDHFAEGRRVGFKTPEMEAKLAKQEQEYLAKDKELDKKISTMYKEEGEYADLKDTDWRDQMYAAQQEKADNLKAYNELYQKQSNLVQEAPLSETWYKTLLRRGMMEAARAGGYDVMTVVGPDTQVSRTNADVGSNTEKRLQKFYGPTVGKFLQEEAAKYNSNYSTEKFVDREGKTHTLHKILITPAMKERMPMFRDEQHATNLLESDKEPTRKFEGYEVIEDAPGVNRYVVRGTDGNILAAAQVANINNTRRITDFQIAEGAENEGVGAYLLQKIKGVGSSAAIDNAASEVAYVSPKFRIDYPKDENGWVDFGKSLKGSPLTQEEETHIRNSFQTNPDENIMLLNTMPLKKSIPEFLLKVYKAGLLSGTGTTATNMLSNASMLALEEVAKIPSALLDIAISKATGQPRMFLGPSIEGVKEGLKGMKTQGWEDFKEALTTGDFENIYQIPVHAGIPVLDSTIGKGADYVFRFMSAQDKLFKGYMFRRAMFEQAKLEELNGGRAVADVMANPTLEQTDMALRATAYATFQQDNILNDKYITIKAAAEKHFLPFKWFLDLNLPFVKTGTNVAVAGLDYLGVMAGAKIIHEGYKAIDMKSLTQTGKNMVAVLQEPTTRQEITELSGRGLVGFAILYAGYKLAEAGLLTANYDDKDKKEINSQAEKNAPFLSLKVGNRYVTFQRLNPVGTFFAAGARMYADKEKGISKQMGGVSRMIIGQFPLGKFAQDISGNKEALDYIVPAGNSFVPNIVRDFAKFGDVKRETKVQGDSFDAWWETKKNQFKSAVPGLRSTLPKRTTALGQEISEGEPILGSTEARGSKLIDELTRLKWFPAHSTRDKTSQLFVERPLPLRKEITKNLEMVVDSPEYNDLPDDEAKQNWLIKATGITIKEYEKDNPDPDQEEKKEAKKAKAEVSKEHSSTIRKILGKE